MKRQRCIYCGRRRVIIDDWKGWCAACAKRVHDATNRAKMLEVQRIGQESGMPPTRWRLLVQWELNYFGELTPEEQEAWDYNRADPPDNL